MTCWTAFSLIIRIASNSLSSVNMLFYQSIGVGLVALLMSFKVLPHGNIPVSRNGILWALLAGVINVVGIYFFSKALSFGKIGMTTGIVGSYPILVALCAWLLFGETLGPRQLLGLLVTICGVILIVWK